MTKQIKRSITRFFKGFTLVELIIVIAIIAILSVTAFMTITKWIGESRDSRRLSDIGSIHRALNYNYVDQSTSEKYPLPDEAQTITGENGEILWKQGVFGADATEETSTLTKTPEDPNGEKYEYSVTEDQETYEVYAKLENGEEISYLTDKAYAKPEKYIAKRGNYNGYIVGNTGSDYKLYNAPSIYLTTGAQLTSGTTNNIYQEGKKEDIQVNITGTNINDLYNGGDVKGILKTISNNYPDITDTTKAQEIVNNAGNNTESVTTSSSDSLPKDCNEILNNNSNASNGNYEIDPDGDGSGFEVYCDMTTDGGGWTRITLDIVKNNMSSSFIEHKGYAKWDNGYIKFGENSDSSTDARVDIDLGFSFSKFFLKDFAYEDVSPSGDSWDSGDEHHNCEYSNTCTSTRGDITFGSSDNNNPTTSFSYEGAETTDCDGCTYSFPENGEIYNLGINTKIFTIRGHESGSQSEHVRPWGTGYIFVK